MDKKSSQSKIPNLGNGSRIPCPNALRSGKPSKTGKSFGLINFRSQASSLLPKSLPTEKICQASSLIQKTFTQSRLLKSANRLHTQSSKLVVDEETDKVRKNCGTKTVNATSMAQPTVDCPIKLLTRSETFTRDCDEDMKGKLLQSSLNNGLKTVNLTYDAKGDRNQSGVIVVNSDNKTITKFEQFCMDQSNLFDTTRCLLSSTRNLDDTVKSFSLADISYKTVNSDSPRLKQGKSLELTDSTLVPGDMSKKLATRRLFNLSMPQRSHLIDVSQSGQSPSLWTNINPDINNTKLLYMTVNRNEIEDITLTPDRRSSEDGMDVEENPDSGAQHTIQQMGATATDLVNAKARFSFGLDLTECTLDCSIELCDSSVTSSAALPSSPSCQLKKQNSFELDESLGILTPDQMKEFLDSTNTNLDLPLQFSGKLPMHQCRVDQTPSPEELPLDPIAVKTDDSDIVMGGECLLLSGIQQTNYQEQQYSQSDSYSKTDQMTKSATSKVSNSIITSITSITSLDTGYQGDGEMSRPASRGGDHSPSNVPRINAGKRNLIAEPSYINNNNNNNQNIPIVRRQDPMTDSDFFTESDADDIFHRGDRRAQVIDGQLYGPMVHGENIYVEQQPPAEDSCMESSGIFTDAENRCDEDLVHQRNDHDSDLSPDGSTDTIKSNNTEYSKKTTALSQIVEKSATENVMSIVNISCEKSVDRQSIISDASIGSIQSGVSGSTDSNLHMAKPKKTSPSRKQNKNEANVALKKHEMSKRGVVGKNTVVPSPSAGGSDTENQENKRPSVISDVSLRKPMPNKWDAIMNKIAMNKTAAKTTNYSEVKPKVTCGLARRDSPKFLKSPNSQQSPISKKRPSSSTKRGRTHSKDSQSSQSDLSLMCGSPKSESMSSTNFRSAKKRDVRTISITSSDLEPQIKSSDNSKPLNIKPITVQKRSSPNGSVYATVTPLDTKSSPKPTKNISKRTTLQKATKAPLKDQNHLLGSTNSSPKGILSPKSAVKAPPSHTLPQTPTVPYHRNGNVTHLDRVTQKSLSNSNQIERIVNNVKLSNCLSSDALATPKTDNINLNLHQSNKGVAALGVLIQHLVFNLDAFSNPQLKKSNGITKKELSETKNLLDNVRLTCANLEEKLIEKDNYYANREKDLQELHTCELNKVKNGLAELEQKLGNEEAQSKIAKNKELELLKRISALSFTENELREKVHVSEKEFGERLRTAANRERELTDKVRQLEQMNKEMEDKERALQDKLHIIQDEVVVLRTSKSLIAEASINSLTSPPTKPRMLQEEIESLRCVLELKQKEISELRKQNNELQTASEALPNALIKISGLESRLEDLQIQLKSKCDEEKHLLNKTKCLQESYAHEVKNRDRLSLHNEELQWKLKQNSEKFALTLNELSKSYQDHAEFLDDAKASLYGQETSSYALEVSPAKSNGSEKFGDCFHMDDISPPTSPMIKGVVQKSDSVSWVLEINDEESAEAMASRLVKRTGSFRSSFNEKYNQPQAIKRHLAQSNALSQSASATSVLRQHSELLTLPHVQHSGSRRRSKSVSFKSSEPKKIFRSNSGATRKNEIALSWNDQSSSMIISPTIKRSRQASTKENKSGKDLLLSEESETETSSMKPHIRSNSATRDESYTEFKRNHAFKSNTKKGLITCYSSPMTIQRSDQYKPMAAHPSVQDLKKCQQIKESAGEAMVSGTNSEDEAETASSDDSISVGSSRSSSSHSGRLRSSIEDQLIRKIVASLDSTPMEVSWSEDADQFVNESIV